MKNLWLILLLGCGPFVKAQQRTFILKDKDTQKEFIKKDSLSAVTFLDSLAQNSYYFTQVVKVENLDHNILIHFDKGKNYQNAKVLLTAESADFLKLKKEFVTHNIDSLKTQIALQYAQKGYAFNRVKSIYQGFENGLPKVEIFIVKGDLRKVNGIVIQGYTKSPKRFVKNLEKEFVGKPYTQEILQKLSINLRNHLFVTLEKSPQTLFTKDSTEIYLNLQKKKSNFFDGIIGFGNDQQDKITFNGNLSLELKNVLNSFETISVFWQRNPQSGQNFDLNTDIPYLFKSNIGTQASLNVYRQDSTFANFRFKPSFYYQLKTQQKLGVRAHIEISSVLNETNLSSEDFTKNGFGFFYHFNQPSEEILFQYNTKILIEADFLNSNYQKQNLKLHQTLYSVFAEHNLPIIGNHYLNLKIESSMINSKASLKQNELFRIGGYRSLRGFNEQSIFTDFYAYGGLEYRYLSNNQAFFDVFGQWASVRNTVSRDMKQLFSVGIGFNFLLPLGIMSFQISNGQQEGNPFRFQDTKIHWGLISKF